MSGACHLYVHVPFCAERCGYCDFVSLVGRRGQHARYVEALLAELELERGFLDDELETIYLGGGTPTFLESAALRRLLDGLPPAEDVTVEVNPETVNGELSELLVAAGVSRVSLGAQSFQPHLLRVLERHVSPDEVLGAVQTLRDVGIDNISLDLLYGIPGQSVDDLENDLRSALELAPEHLSCYELEAKPGTRFTHSYGAELARQSDAMETYFEQVVERLTDAGYRWYETANFARVDGEQDLRSAHNLAYWRGRDYLGLGIGAVSTLDGRRWRNHPSLPAYIAALEQATRPRRELEEIDALTQLRERLMLGLRLDEPLSLNGLEPVLDLEALGRLERLELVSHDSAAIALTRRGRFLGDAVSADLISEPSGRLAA